MNLKALFNKRKKESVDKDTALQSPSFSVRINNMKNIGFAPKCIFDCGASVGHWSCGVSKLFPGSQIVAIEPNTFVLPQTKKTLSDIRPAVIIEECALGATSGDVHLNIWDNDHTKMSGSSLKDHVQGSPKSTINVRLDTLDIICERHGLTPDLVKLDLQGGELDALKGAEMVLGTAEVFIIEFGCLQAYVDRTTPFDLMDTMYSNDYCLYDIIDLIYRPYDNALTGGDFIFVKNSSQLKKYKGYA